MKKSIFIGVRIDPTTNKIIPINKLDEIQLDFFIKNNKNSDFQLTLTLQDEAKSAAQLAKVHAGIKDIAEFSGMSFNDVKQHIKREASLYEFNGEISSLKSFSNCTKKELDASIKIMEQFAANIGCVLSY